MGTRGRKPDRKRGPRRWASVIVVVAVVAALVGAGAIVWTVVAPMTEGLFAGEPEDYEGDGDGEVVVRIEEGWTGTDVATMLADEDVVASAEAFTDLLMQDSSITFQPGSYQLASQMSAQAALDALQDPESKVELQVVVPEGFMLQQVYARLEESTGIDQAEFEAAGEDPTAFGLPADERSIEGWLFPATYTFDDGTTPEQMLQAMVDRMRQALTEHGVEESDWHRVVTFASLVQREAGPESNMPQVAAVFQNRLDQDMLLQSDATVAYGTGNTHIVTTTDEERGDADNPYNTYIHPGLPVGPIGAPGDAAIASVLEPADGDWLYFVTVNLETGETVFSESLAEHDAAVEQFQAWLAEHPEYLE